MRKAWLGLNMANFVASVYWAPETPLLAAAWNLAALYALLLGTTSSTPQKG